MLLHRFFTPGLAINSYIIADETSRRAAVIDPVRNINDYISYAVKEKLIITDILETHVHADFASGSLELKKALGEAPKIYCSAMGGKEWSPTYADHLVKDKEEIDLGSLRLQAYHTPGHTPEHLMWLVFDKTSQKSDTPIIAFTGDLIFVGSVGRPDLLGKEIQAQLAQQLYESLFERIPTLPGELELLPAHGAGSLCGKEIGKQPSSTLSQEWQHNSGLKKEEFEKWSEALLKDMPAAPNYFKRMKRMNISGFEKSAQHSYAVLNAIQALSLMSQCTVIDVRTPHAFAHRHLKGSINIPPSPSFPFWAATAVSGEEKIILVVSAITEAPSAIESLKLVGIDAIQGIVLTSSWEDDNEKILWKDSLESNPNMNVEALAAKKDDMYILDVRTRAEWNTGHIPEAHLIELARLNDSLELIPKDKPIAVICHSGNRSSLATSILKKAGFSTVVSVAGGMQAWQKNNPQ